MFRIILASIFLICCWKWGDWRNWKKYYPTILYYILLDFLYNMLFANYSLWEYGGLFPNHSLNDIFVAIIMFPCITLLYLPYYPKKIDKQVYILFSAILLTTMEAVAFAFGLIKYYHSWNIWCSAAFWVATFVVLILHHKKPLIALPITTLGIIIVVVLTKLPIENMK